MTTILIIILILLLLGGVPAYRYRADLGPYPVGGLLFVVLVVLLVLYLVRVP